MLALPKSKVRAVGVSNFTIEQLEGIIAATGIAPVYLIPLLMGFFTHPIIRLLTK